MLLSFPDISIIGQLLDDDTSILVNCDVVFYRLSGQND